MKDDSYSIEFTREELTVIQRFFHVLTTESLKKWMSLVPAQGGRISPQCQEQWHMTNVYDEVRRKTGIALGLEKPVSEKELEKMMEDAGFPPDCGSDRA